MKAAEELESAQESILNHILRVVFITRQPAGQVVRGIQMRHNYFFETCLFIVFVHDD